MKSDAVNVVESGMIVNEIEHRVNAEPPLTPNGRPLRGALSKLPLLRRSSPLSRMRVNKWPSPQVCKL